MENCNLGSINNVPYTTSDSASNITFSNNNDSARPDTLINLLKNSVIEYNEDSQLIFNSDKNNVTS